ncbi:MAG: hypothetical protein Q3966_04235 [Neisseria sp.]|nr:hypothetical protein [Neisseria sp.]
MFILFLAHKSGKKLREKELFLFFLIIAIILSLLSAVYLMISSYQLPIFLVVIIAILIVFNFCIARKDDRYKQEIIILLIIIINFYVIQLFAYHNLSVAYLNPTRIIETPKNASWYLLHNNFSQNNSFHEANGINRYDLEKLKREFDYPNLCTPPQLRENALYGYMAWNLGDTKVFCPVSVRNDGDKAESKKIADKCIVISGKALQIMPQGYIGIASSQGRRPM